MKQEKSMTKPKRNSSKSKGTPVQRFDEDFDNDDGDCNGDDESFLPPRSNSRGL